MGKKTSKNQTKRKNNKHLNVRPDTIKLLEKNTGRTLPDANPNHTFLDPSPEVMEIHTKLNKWDLIKFKSSCTAKEIINKTKRQLTSWKKTFANNATKTGLTSKTYKQLIKLNNNTQPKQKTGRRPKEIFLQRHTHGHQAHEKTLDVSSH